MRIGTVTFYEIEDNYGCILQCFALPRFLALMGHDPFFIKSRYDVQGISRPLPLRVLSRIRPWITHPVSNYRRRKNTKDFELNRQIRRMQALEHSRQFKQFMGKYIPSTEKIYNQFELLENPPIASAYVCGSDQIWGGCNPTMYLRFAPSGAKKISYAASFGGLVPDETTLSYIKESISDFELVTLREQSGVDLCRGMLGRDDALLVPDPTLLLDANEYRKVSNNGVVDRATEKPYIFLYLLGNTMAVQVEEIVRFAANNNLDIKYVASGGRIDEYPKIYPTVEEWLYLLDNSSYVITNSFHGTVFSLLFKKKFMTIPLVNAYQRMNVRIETLLNGIGLSNRIYNNKFDEIFESVNFNDFEISHSEEIRRVKELFEKTLE